MNHAIGARKLLRQCRHAALATHSRRMQGYPYASVVPIMLDRDAHPIMCVSRLAEHTKNIDADERVSIVAHTPADDIQAAPRLTLLGSCRRAEDRDALAERYLRYFPSAAQLLALDFDFYRISAAAVRYIGGFGSVHWLSSEAIKPPPGDILRIEARIIEETSARYAEALRECCRRLHGIAAAEVRMIGLDCDGFDARANDQLVRFEFVEPVNDAASVRAALAALLERDG